MSSNVKNTINRPDKDGNNFVDLAQNQWGIDGVAINCSAQDINDACAGGGTGTDYQDTYWIDKAGFDSNDGRSITTPKLTLQDTVSNFVNPTNVNVINIPGGGDYNETVTFPAGSKVIINAPGATFTSNSAGVATFINNGDELTLDVKSVGENGSGGAIENTSQMSLRTQNISGDISNTGNIVSAVIKFDIGNMAGNFVADGGTMQGYVKTQLGDFTAAALPNNIFEVTFDSWTGAFAAQNTALRILGKSLGGGSSITMTETGLNQSSCVGYVGSIPNGFIVNDSAVNVKTVGQFGNKLYLNSPFDTAQVFGDTFFNGTKTGGLEHFIFKNDTTIVNIDASNYRDYWGATVVYDNASTTHFFIENDAGVPVGFWMKFLQAGAARIGTIQESSTIPVSVTANTTNKTQERGSWMIFGKLDNAAEPLYYAYGDLNII